MDFRSKNTLLGKNEIERTGLRFWIMSQRWTLWSLQLFLGLRWTKLNRFQILLWRWTWCRRGAIGEFELESTSYVWKRHATVPVYYDSISSWSSSRDSCWMSKKTSRTEKQTVKNQGIQQHCVSWLNADASIVSRKYQTNLAHREYRTKHQAEEIRFVTK